jgi:cytochrome c-type biogenesis protein CcsB
MHSSNILIYGWLNPTQLENYLVNLTFVSLFLTSLTYWIEIIFFKPNQSVNFKARSFLEPLTPVLEGAAQLIPPSKEGLYVKSEKLGLDWIKGQGAGISKLFMISSNLFLVFLLITRWENSGHFPLSNLYESLLFLSWSLSFLHLILSINFSLYVQTLLGCITAPLALLMNLFAEFSLPKEMQQASPLVPALQSNWLTMHVTVMIISYGCLMLGSAFSVLLLILNFTRSFVTKQSAPTFANLLPPSYNPPLYPLPVTPRRGVSPQPRLEREGKGGKGSPTQVKSDLPPDTEGLTPSSTPFGLNLLRGVGEGGLYKGEGGKASTSSSFPRESVSPFSNLIQSLDILSYRFISLGFPFLSIGILSGAVWANEAWGSYWSWDPKETWALLTWLIFAVYLHSRLNHAEKGQKPAVIASAGFFLVWFCYLGVNLIGEGLHSYGFFTR